MKVVLIISIFLSTLFSQEKIILTTHNLPPYSYKNELKPDGIAIKPVVYALEKMNISYEIKFLPWQRAQAMVENQIADGFFAASKNAKRDKFAVLSETIAEQKWNWYWLKDKNFDINSEKFKKEVSVSSFNGANMQKWLKNNSYNVIIQPQNTNHAISLLLANRFDALLANNFVMENLIKKRSLENQFTITTQKNKPLGVYFSKLYLEKNPSFLKGFNYYIKEYKERKNK